MKNRQKLPPKPARIFAPVQALKEWQRTLPKRWQTYLSSLTVAIVITIVIPWVIILASAGWSLLTIPSDQRWVLSYFYVFLIYPFMCAGLITTLLTVLTLPIALYKYRPKKYLLRALIALLVLLAAYFIWYGGPVIKLYLPKHLPASSHPPATDHAEDKRIKANTLSRSEALTIVNSCQLEDLIITGPAALNTLYAKRPSGQRYTDADTSKYVAKEDIAELKAAVINTATKCGYDDDTVYDPNNGHY